MAGGHSEASLADNIIPRFFRKRTGSLFSNRSDTIQEATDDEDSGIPPPVDPELGGPSHASISSLLTPECLPSVLWSCSMYGTLSAPAMKWLPFGSAERDLQKQEGGRVSSDRIGNEFGSGWRVTVARALGN